MSSLVDQFCPNVHDAPITAATLDPWTGVIATADADGVVAVTRQGESAPGLLFQPGVAVYGSLALNRKGLLLGWGDENGSVGVYRVEDGSPVFEELRDEQGRVRAMRGVAVSPVGDRFAAIAVDGLLRIWNLQTGKKVAWQDFSGNSVSFDPKGARILCLDKNSQPAVIDLVSNQRLFMERLQMPADRAVFTHDGTHIVVAGLGGIALIRVVDGKLINTHAAKGGSGIINIVFSTDGKQVSAVSQRSVHVFSLPELQPVPELSRRHGAPDPTGAAWWGGRGLVVAGKDGLLYGSGKVGAGPVVSVGGFGNYRLAGHTDRVAAWVASQREREFMVGGRVREAHVDRDGAYLMAVPEEGEVSVFDFRTGAKIYGAGPESWYPLDVGLGGGIVAILMQQGGVRWMDLVRNKAYQLDWPQGMALSHGGTWLGVITPRGAVRILSPVNGQQVVPEPELPQGVIARQLAFISKRPDLLVVDQDRVLTHFDLAASVRESKPARGRDVLTLYAEIDKLWGITGGRYAAVRIPEGGTATIMFVDLQSAQVVTELTGLHPKAWVDAEYGLILEPVRGGAILEREMDGTERRCLRVMTDGEWVCFGQRGLIDASEGFGQ
jgi:hypothetical protein